MVTIKKKPKLCTYIRAGDLHMKNSSEPVNQATKKG